MSDTLETLLVEHNGPVTTVTLNRPAVHNALNATLFAELDRVFAELADREETRVILLTGAGEKAFAAGADIRELVPLDQTSGRAFSERGQAVFHRIEQSTKPVIAVLRGVAFGGGLELALVATLRLAADSAKLGLPETRLGLIPGYGGTQRLARLIGRSAALRMMLAAEPVGADEALRLGLVDEVLPADQLIDRANALATTIAANAPRAIEAVLRAVPRDSSEPLPVGLEREAGIFAELCASADKAEGVEAFLARRKPVWRGE